MEEPTPNFLTCPIAPELLPPEPQEGLAPAKRHVGRWMVLVAAVAVLLLLSPLMYGGLVAGMGARQVKADFSHAQAAFLAHDLASVQTEIRHAQDGLSQIRAGLDATGFWKSMPIVGRHIRAFQDAAQVGFTATESVLAVLHAASTVQETFVSAVSPRSFVDLTSEEKRIVLARVNDALPEVRIAREKAAMALAAWNQIPRAALIGPVQHALEPIAQPLIRWQRVLDEGVSLADIAMPMMGYSKEKTYLLLPYFADGSPDFPQAAERAMSVQPGVFSGAVALTPAMLVEMRGWIGPLPSDGKITGAEISDALMAALEKQPLSLLPEFVQTAADALSRKDVLMYDRDPGLLAVLDAYHWSGRTLATASDYLWVVDTASDKVVRYSLDTTDPSGSIATVTLSNKKSNSAANGFPDHVRVYVPEGSALISSSGVSGNVDVYKELGKTVFAGTWPLEPGENKEFGFVYRLPTSTVSSLDEGMYQLLVQKQPGANTRLTLDLKFGKNVVSATPPEDPKDFGDARYQQSLPLDRDQTFDLKLLP